MSRIVHLYATDLGVHRMFCNTPGIGYVDALAHLYNKLRESVTADGSGFWKQRMQLTNAITKCHIACSLPVYHAMEPGVLYHDWIRDHPECVVGFCVITETKKFVDMVQIQSFVERQGVGKAMLVHLHELYGKKPRCVEPVEGSELFWVAMLREGVAMCTKEADETLCEFGSPSEMEYGSDSEIE